MLSSKVKYFEIVMAEDRHLSHVTSNLHLGSELIKTIDMQLAMKFCFVGYVWTDVVHMDKSDLLSTCVKYHLVCILALVVCQLFLKIASDMCAEIHI